MVPSQIILHKNLKKLIICLKYRKSTIDNFKKNFGLTYRKEKLSLVKKRNSLNLNKNLSQLLNNNCNCKKVGFSKKSSKFQKICIKYISNKRMFWLKIEVLLEVVGYLEVKVVWPFLLDKIGCKILKRPLKNIENLSLVSRKKINRPEPENS